uniref:Protein kinase domain-containing protein n=1 Tax=Panagrellus redivivus TaxID=6233 RepID=A0A7E4W9I5_PANRE
MTTGIMSQQPPVAAPSSSVAPLPRHPPSVPPLNPEKRAARNLNMAVFKNAIEVGSLVPNDAFELMRVEDIYYSRIIKIGQGTFGEVFKAKCVKTGTIVALKKILMENEKEGFPITALREINMLKSLRHPNVTELVDICSSGSKEKGKTVFFLVFAFCDHDLAGILAKNNLIISAVDAKTMLKQMFEGLNYIHGCEVLHRDMKTANILVSKDGYLKLADFGLARPKIRNAPCYTNRVVTMWYRPPELLLGERSYAGEIDVWGAGCIMAEFWTRTPIFQGHTEQHQLQLICNMCGSINESTMAKARQYPVFRDIDPNFLRGSREVTAKLKKLIKIDSAVDLIERIFTLEPSMRPTAHDALRHKYFNEEPLPKENFADFMRSAAFSGSLFEYTSKSGAHRKPAQQRPTRPPPQVPRTQMVDRIF